MANLLNQYEQVNALEKKRLEADKKKTHKAVHLVGDDNQQVAQNAEDAGPMEKQSAQNKPKEPAARPVPEASPIGGAFYLELLKSPTETFEELKNALDKMADTDYSVSPDDFACHGIVYSDDKWMMARSQIVQLDDRQGSFLELNKLEGDGFVFADLFKKNLAEALKGTVKDDAAVQAEVFEEDSDYKFLDFGADEDSALMLMNQFLNNLKPSEGLAKGYDQTNVFAAVSCLGHNIAENFEFINGFQEPIVEGVLEVLRFEETTFLPTVYFGSKLISAFLEEDRLDSDLKQWKNVQMLVEALNKHCIGEQTVDTEMGGAGRQVMKSRESMKILSAAICKFAALCEASELTPKMKDSFTKIFEQVPDKELQSNLLQLL